MTDKRKAWWLKVWREWAQPMLIVLIVGFSFRSAVADWNYVPTGSMKPTILDGDRIFVNKLAYDLKVPFTSWRLTEWADPRRGDVVVFYEPQHDVRYVKRVVAIPGDTAELRDNQLWLNGEPATYAPLDRATSNAIPRNERPDYRFAAETIDGQTHPVMITPGRPGLRSFGPIVVPEGQYFLMGDNRDNSLDSRWFGFVTRDRIVGRATAVAISVDPNDHYWPRWQRFFRSLR